MDSAGYAVLLLDVELGESVSYSISLQKPKSTLDGRGLLKISLGRSIDNVSHLETLNGLILQDYFPKTESYFANTAEAVSASDGSHMTSSLLGTSVVSKHR